MFTIGTNCEGTASFKTPQPLGDECLIVPDPVDIVPFEAAQLALQIFLIHSPWSECRMGSIIGYDLSDTKQLFAGEVVKVTQITSDRVHYHQRFSEFIRKNEEVISRAQGILISFWGRDDVLSVPIVNELWNKSEQIMMPDTQWGLTFHMLPDDGADFMATLFLT